MKLFGKNPVLERLRTNPQSIKKIYVQEGLSDASLIKKKAAKNGIPVLTVPRSKILKMGRNLNTQGIIVQVEDFEYLDFDELLRLAIKNKRCILFLDGLNDPQNLGAIIRGAACMGRFSIVLPSHGSVGVTEAVLRVACGGDNYLPIAKVANINNAIKKAKKEGFFIAGSVVEGGKNLYEETLPFPLGLVIGSEQKGIRDIVLKSLDVKLTIPMNQNTLSLNAAQATNIFCYEIERQKRLK